jgi:hypothetical protein
MDWIYVANDRDQWWVLVKIAMNISGSSYCYKFLE